MYMYILNDFFYLTNDRLDKDTKDIKCNLRDTFI